MPAPDFLTNRAWFTRTVCSHVDFLSPFCFPVPDLQEFSRDSLMTGGEYSMLLQISSFCAWPVPSLTNTSVHIRGFATDPLIVPGDLTQPTNDNFWALPNFQSCTVQFRKQGERGGPVIKTITSPVPDRATWSTGLGDPPVDDLAVWDLAWIDCGVPAPNDFDGNSIPDGQRLARGTSCTYDVSLTASDLTIVSESTDHDTGLLTFPVKIVNDLP